MLVMICLLHIFFPVQFKMYSKKPICTPSCLRSFPTVASETVPMFIRLMMALSCPFKEDRLSLPLSFTHSFTSSFFYSLLQTINGVMSLALCPQVVSEAPQHFRSSEKQATCEASFAHQCICSVISLHSRHVQGSTPTGVFEGGCQPFTHSSQGFPFHISLFAASSLNL